MVSIDGVEYVPTTGKRVRINDVEYAEVKALEVPPAPKTTRIIDGDGDEWHREGTDDSWDYRGRGYFTRSRAYISREYHIQREY